MEPQILTHHQQLSSLSVAFHQNQISFHVVSQKPQTKNHQFRLICPFQKLPPKFTKIVSNVEQAKAFFKNENNFIIRQPFIILIIKHSLQNKTIEERVALQLQKEEMNFSAEALMEEIKILKARVTVVEEKVERLEYPELKVKNVLVSPANTQGQESDKKTTLLEQRMLKIENQISEFKNLSSRLTFDSQSKTQFNDHFDRTMRHFERQMQSFEKYFHEKMEQIQKETIQWTIWENGYRRDGEYEGEITEGKPNGIGIFTYGDNEWKIEGEWKDGKLNGRTIEGDLYSQELGEMKDGMKDGKWIVYRSDGDYLHMEFSQGQKHGRFRWCTRHGTILDESLLANGKHLRRIV